MPAPRQAPSTGVDDFPPLGRNGIDGNDEQRGGMMQGGAFGAFSNQNAFSSQQDGGQPRQGLPAGLGQIASTRSSSVVDRTMSPGTYGCEYPIKNRSRPSDNLLTMS